MTTFNKTAIKIVSAIAYATLICFAATFLLPLIMIAKVFMGRVNEVNANLQVKEQLKELEEFTMSEEDETCEDSPWEAEVDETGDKWVEEVDETCEDNPWEAEVDNTGDKWVEEVALVVNYHDMSYNELKAEVKKYRKNAKEIKLNAKKATMVTWLGNRVK